LAGGVDRENKITQDILAKFLQRRLFPHARQPSQQRLNQAVDAGGGGLEAGDEESEGSERVQYLQNQDPDEDEASEEESG